MIFVDASALVAIAAREPDALGLARVLQTTQDRLCSAISLWETAAGLHRSHMFSIATAREHVGLLRELFALRLVPVGEREYAGALQAYAEFGKGRHPAALNMGDCFAYACAKSHQAALLFTGGDFTKTDIRAATL